MMEEYVILVDEQDTEQGFMNKMEAHDKGMLHRAFSVFIFNSKGEMLVQQRAFHKYHSGGLWTNACCSHPRPGEDLIGAAERRLKEEMGFETPLQKLFDFIYRVELDNGLTEHEFDHVLVGEFDKGILFNEEEVNATRYMPVPEVHQTLKLYPEKFTAWFQLAFPSIEEWWKERYLQNNRGRVGYDPDDQSSLSGA
jgi:isopentenyl-diphosphate delta-isomerase